MILEPKHKNLKDEYKIKERVKQKFDIRRQMSVLVALELHYFQELLNWWHSAFKEPLGKKDCGGFCWWLGILNTIRAK